jgi:ubiquitin C
MTMITTINTTIKTTIKTTINNTTKCCAANGCGKRPAPIIGDCVYCNSKFCAQHRLPETHECSKLKECRQTAKTENAERLNSQSMSSVMNVGY